MYNVYILYVLYVLCILYILCLLYTVYCVYCMCYRSHIHGLGLYAKKTIDAGDMVVEYAGTLIRSVLTDKREKYYDEKVF